MTDAPIAAGLTPGRAWRHGRVAAGLAVRASPGTVVALVVAAVLAGLAPVATAWLLKLLLDALGDGQRGSVLIWLATALAVIGVLAAVLPFISSYLEGELRRAASLRSLGVIFSRVNSRLRGLATLEDPRFHDRLQMAGSAGVAAPGEVVQTTLAFGRGLLTLSGFLAVLVAINPWLLLAVAASAVPTVRAELTLSRRWVGAWWRIEHADRRRAFYASLLSSPTEAKEIRLFGLGRFFQARMLSELDTANRTERSLERRELAVRAGLSLLGAVIAGGGLVWAISAAQGGRLTVGDISVFVAALAGVQGGVSELISTFRRLHQSLLMLDHYQEVVNVSPDLPIAARTRTTPALRDRIELHDVWFRYRPDLPWVLRGVSLQIPAGATTALVGLNGSGKSTIVKLICRLYDPVRGSITWDGIDLRELDPDDLRLRISAVFQDYVMYDLSAAENIGVGDLSLITDRARIQAAATMADVHATLAALPAGYDTLLTRMYMSNADRDDPDTGVGLSGGQGQRVALARAFLRERPDLLILDEPSSGLDPLAEADINRRLRTYRTDRTSLLVSHRLNTVR
ncbi:MAG: ABC transporter ATP-binding protein, partial [Micromonosporaceae bacterium]